MADIINRSDSKYDTGVIKIIPTFGFLLQNVIDWFQEGKGPGYYALEPFEIGLAFTFND